MTQEHPTPQQTCQRGAVSALWIYPVKSLDGVAVSQAQVAPGGGFCGDRQFMMVDEAGEMLNGKRTPKVHGIRAEWLLNPTTQRPEAVRLNGDGPFRLAGDQTRLAQWLAAWFGMPVRLQENLVTGFPDDLDAAGPTVVAEATLAAVAGWYAGMTPEQMAERMRCNVHLRGVPAFGEDALIPPAGQVRPFWLGETRLDATGCCARCIVPTRDPRTGAPGRGFQRTFMTKRAETLPEFAEKSRFDHFFRLTLNTRCAFPGAWVRVGDPVFW